MLVPLRYLVVPSFQSTLPRGERRRLFPVDGAKPSFQSTLPRGERQNRLFCVHIDNVFQSTLPRGERPQHDERARGVDDVSIHAPTRGATSSSALDVAFTQSFNPRSHAGSDIG